MLLQQQGLSLRQLTIDPVYQSSHCYWMKDRKPRRTPESKKFNNLFQISSNLHLKFSEEVVRVPTFQLIKPDQVNPPTIKEVEPLLLAGNLSKVQLGSLISNQHPMEQRTTNQ